MANLTKDQRIIKDNPGLSPYDLLQKGLSQKGYEDLIAQQDKEKVAPVSEPKPQPQEPQRITPVAPTIKTTVAHRAIPTTHLQHTSSTDGTVTLVHKTGRRTQMSRASATRWMQKYPGEYKIK